jgi:hypothetical protein
MHFAAQNAKSVVLGYLEVVLAIHRVDPRGLIGGTELLMPLTVPLLALQQDWVEAQLNPTPSVVPDLRHQPEAIEA